ncbi:MAG: hypothetical protein ACRBG0_05075 [Lewinella sp.]|uniref:hypothetical protein n=1 Tax=Lewinella sp. TaxID=2004506 RepID=UPI003D6C68D0
MKQRMQDLYKKLERLELYYPIKIAIAEDPELNNYHGIDLDGVLKRLENEEQLSFNAE